MTEMIFRPTRESRTLHLDGLVMGRTKEYSEGARSIHTLLAEPAVVSFLANASLKLHRLYDRHCKRFHAVSPKTLL